MSSNLNILADTTLAILAGGQSSRMGRPKSHLTVNNQPILQFILNRLNWPGPTLLITAPGNEHPPGDKLFDVEATDADPNQGPLRGILTALDHCPSAKLALMPVDMPALGLSQFFWLATHVRQSGIMLRRAGRIEPLPLLLKIDAKAAIESLFASGERSLHALARLPDFDVIDAPADWPAEIWTNLNTPGDFERFTRNRL